MIVNHHNHENVKVKDTGWIVDLLKHGFVKASYILHRKQRKLREITRYRQEIVNERAR
jgi:transposase